MSTWNERYLTGDLPWDSGLVSRQLAHVLDDSGIAPGRALELGCGTGTNSVYLAQRGFRVTALDLAEAAIELARQKAAAAGADIDFIAADLTGWQPLDDPFDLIFDRGCYHCVRRENLAGYRTLLRRALRQDGHLICFCGNANERGTDNMPRVFEHQLRAELGRDLTLLDVRPFRFQDAGGAEGPLGWSVLGQRRPTAGETAAGASVVDRITAQLDALSIEYQLSRHEPVFTSAEAAAVRGAPLASGAKALVCKADEQWLLFVVPADRKLASKAVRTARGWRSLRFASREELLSLTGLEPGAIPPMGSLFNLPVLCDARLLEQPTINFNAGDHAISLRMQAADYLRAEQPEVGHFSE